MWLKNAAKFAGGLLLAAGLLWWLLRDTDLHAVWSQVRRASAPGLALAVVLMVGHNVFRTWRWRALLEPVRRNVPFRPMFDAIILGYMTTWIVPGRLGELVRPVLLAGRTRIPLGACLGTVLADRLLDGFGVLVLFSLGVAITPLSGEAAQHAAWIRGGAALLVLAIAIPFGILIAVSSRREWLESWFEGKSGAIAWIGRFTLAMARGVEALKRPRLLARSLFHTLAAWLMIAAGTWVGVLSCGADISFGAMLVIQPLLVLGIALPTPGGAGGYHAALTFGLYQLFAVNETVAVGASFVVHLIVLLPIVVLGFVLLYLDHIPFKDLLAAGRQVRGLGGPRQRSTVEPELAVSPKPVAEKLT